MDSTSTHNIPLDSLAEVYQYTESLCPNWRLLGDELGIPLWIIDETNVDNPIGCRHKLRELLAKWLQQQGGEQQRKPSWKALSEAVRHFDASIADRIARDHQCDCQECVAILQQEESPSESSISIGGAEPNHECSSVERTSIRNTSVCNNVRNQNVKEAFDALEKEFTELASFTIIEIARTNPDELRFHISDYVGNEQIKNTALEDHLTTIEKFQKSPGILNYLRRNNLIGSINFDLLLVIQRSIGSELLDKRIEEYEKDYQCFLQLSLNDLCTAYEDCPALLESYPIGLPKFTIKLESEWGGRKTYEWKELLERRLPWAKGLIIVEICKNCIVITYAVWPSMAKAVAYDLTNSEVLADLKAYRVTHVDVSPQLLEFMQQKEEIKLDDKEFPEHEDTEQPINEVKNELKKKEDHIQELENKLQDKDKEIDYLREMKTKMMMEIDNRSPMIGKEYSRNDHELKKKEDSIKELEHQLQIKEREINSLGIRIIDNRRDAEKDMKLYEGKLQALRDVLLQREKISSNLRKQLQMTRRVHYLDNLQDSSESFSHKKISQLLLSAAENGNESEVQTILKQRTDPSLHTDKDGFTALHLASSKGHIKVVAVLLLAGMDVDTKNDDGTTSLHRASYGGHIDTVKLLISNGAFVEACTKRHATPLHRAASNGKKDIVQTLLSNGANIEAKTEAGSTSLHLASAGGHVEVVEVLISNGAFIEAQDMKNATPLHRGATGGHADTVNVLLCEGANLKATLTDGSTPLHKASEGGHSEVVNQLLSKEAPVGLTTFRDQQTPLHLSTFFGHVKASKLLISHSASVNLEDKYGQTPALIAVALNNTEVIEHMLKNSKLSPEDVEKYQLPSNWSASRDTFDGRIQYRNKITGLRQYNHPAISLMPVSEKS